MSGDPNCTVCEGAGWDWRRAADEQIQVDDPVVYYRCPCVKVMRLRAERDTERDTERAQADQLASELKDATEYADWLDLDHLKRAKEVLAAWQEACRDR